MSSSHTKIGLCCVVCLCNGNILNVLFYFSNPLDLAKKLNKIAVTRKNCELLNSEISNSDCDTRDTIRPECSNKCKKPAREFAIYYGHHKSLENQIKNSGGEWSMCWKVEQVVWNYLSSDNVLNNAFNC
jgi:hypothetical protein